MNFKVAVIFTTNHPDTLGNACRLEMMTYLCREFDDVSIHTNHVRFVQSKFSDCPVLELGKTRAAKVPGLKEFFSWRTMADEVNGSDCDFVFMFDDTSQATVWIKKPVYQYVHQYGRRSSNPSRSPIGIMQSLMRIIKDQTKIHGLKKSRMNFVVSQPITDLLKMKGVNNAVHIPHGIRLEKFKHPKVSVRLHHLAKMKDNGYFLMAYTGWVSMNRGFDLMLDSLKEAVKADEKIALIIAGADRRYAQRIKEFAASRNLDGNIINFGIVDADLIPGIIHYADVGLSFLDAAVPAYRISPPQKVLEYFAAGKPVICNTIPTHERLVQHGVNGFVLNPEPGDVAEAVLKLKSDETLYNAMRVQAWTTSKKYHIDAIYGKMVRMIKAGLPTKT